MSGSQAVLSTTYSLRFLRLSITRPEKLVLLCTFALLIVARMPGVLLHGRFWAEEGKVYFVNAWTLPWYEALTTVHADYLNLAASAATLLARYLVPLQDAPRVTVLCALLVQLCPAILLATSRIPWLQHRLAFTLALLLLLAVPQSGEVWLNSITSHFHLMVCVAIVLAAPVQGGTVGVFQGIILTVAPLCGPGAIFAAPLFVLRALADRSRGRAVQALLICASSLLQFWIWHAHPEPGRHLDFNIPLLLTVLFLKNAAVPLLDSHIARHIAIAVQKSMAAGGLPWWPVLGAIGALGLSGTLVVANRRADIAWLYAAALVMALLSYAGAMLGGSDMVSIDFGMRYAYAPSVLFALTLLGLAATSTGAARAISQFGLVMLLVVGMGEYFRVPGDLRKGPNWQAEVAAWRIDPGHRLTTWPRHGDWFFALDPRRQTD
jgi:hypothetical protein